MVHRDKWDELTAHLRMIDKTGSIKYTDKLIKYGSITVLDAYISCKDDGGWVVVCESRFTGKDPHRPIPEFLLPPPT